MTVIEQQGAAAKAAARTLAIAGEAAKNAALESIAQTLGAKRQRWLDANAEDLSAARQSGMREAMLDRLTLTSERIDGIISGIHQVISLPDPIGRVTKMDARPNGLLIGQRRVPLGVIAMIYEARPNVTVDAAVLCLKSGNAVILRGGREAIRSNRVAVELMREALVNAGLPADCISLVQDTSHETAHELMHLNDYVDVLIPRGGAKLIRSVAKNASVPVIRTGEGVCHVYIDRDADLDMGAEILYNAKCSRPSVCNAAECVLIAEDVAEAFLKKAIPLLDRKNTQLRCDTQALQILKERGVAAAEEDWDSEYGDYILAVRIVKDAAEAIAFINQHSSGHSEAIVTSNYFTAQRFLNEVDAAAVYVNASTRFTDGGEFGLGAEIGIST